MKLQRRHLLAATTASLAATASNSRAQGYPTKPITVIVPFAAGGPTDALARVLCQKMSEQLGQQLVVENIGGAGGTIGVNKVAKASSDGYTLLFTHMGTLAVNIALYKSLPYDSQKDLEPIGLGGTNPMVLVTKKDLPATTFPEFMAYVRANQKKVQYGMAGIGAASHLGGLMLNSMMKVEVLEIPYKGTGPALNDLVSGTFDYMVDQAVNVLPQINSGNIKALGVSTFKRLPQLPDVPTVQGALGFPFSINTWYAAYAPKGTPRAIVDKLNAAFNKVLKEPEVKKWAEDRAIELIQDSTPASAKKFYDDQMAFWDPIIKQSGAKPE
jgi:tripartite-type tricarboxylate transporter receptor subunit TctC